MKTPDPSIKIAAALFLLLILFMNCRDRKNPATPTGYDLESAPPPRFVRVNFIDAGRMARISKFRSAVGEDDSDGFESCRSMKHYFEPRSDFDWTSLSLFSPVPGKVVEIAPETVGSQIRIQSFDRPSEKEGRRGNAPIP